ncbi:YceI family protein [Sulfuricurvum sp.]|uniref:YceI family protein n=1 Tax=Sulfuricurvum sp. TaxID=2025608 RepID=UPI002606C5E6|nr:YceI family protein [Sulfuricurvum sp.]MDD2266308.1 YceI family protein [Sulfuricurvum sp.]
MSISYSVKTLTPAEALNLIENGAKILDPITPEAYDCYHIKDALNACVYEVAFLQKVPELIPDKTVPIVIYANSATSHESLVAAQNLELLGYSKVFVVEGGIDALVEAGCMGEGSADGHIEQLEYTSGSYSARVDNAFIGWTGRNANGKHYGTVGLKEGFLQIDGENIHGSFTVDMNDITDLDLPDASFAQMLVAHLRSDDFFSVQSFPEATFTIHSAKRSPAATASSVNHILHGTLSLCGISKTLNIPATFVQSSANTLIIEAHFDFDRTHWGIAYGSAHFFRFLGMHVVFDPVSIEVRFELNTVL